MQRPGARKEGLREGPGAGRAPGARGEVGRGGPRCSSCSLLSALRMQGVLGKCQAPGHVVCVLGECGGRGRACSVPGPPRTGVPPAPKPVAAALSPVRRAAWRPLRSLHPSRVLCSLDTQPLPSPPRPATSLHIPVPHALGVLQGLSSFDHPRTELKWHRHGPVRGAPGIRVSGDFISAGAWSRPSPSPGRGASLAGKYEPLSSSINSVLPACLISAFLRALPFPPPPRVSPLPSLSPEPPCGHRPLTPVPRPPPSPPPPSISDTCSQDLLREPRVPTGSGAAPAPLRPR